MNKQKYNINFNIKHPLVRITGKDIESKIVPIKEAIKIAQDNEMDLIEIVPNAEPPVCKIENFKKFIYNKKQKEKDTKKKTKKIKLKEIRLTYNTGEHDLEFKLNHAKNFLSKGNKVKVTMWFSGREIQFIDAGKLLMLKFVDNLKEYGLPESMPKIDNRRMYVIINPIKK